MPDPIIFGKTISSEILLRKALKFENIPRLPQNKGDGPGEKKLEARFNFTKLLFEETEKNGSPLMPKLKKRIMENISTTVPVNSEDKGTAIKRINIAEMML